MKRYLAASTLALMMSASAFAAKGPEINIIDNKLSVAADSVSLGRLLQLFDLATGMKSKVPPELANRNMTVRFSGLPLTDAVRKMFQGQTFDYVVIEGQGIVITAASQNIAGSESASVNSPPPAVQPGDPFVQDFPQAQGAFPQQGIQQQQQQQQPATVQTPFGAIPNPRAQQQQNPGVAPPQQNSLFPQTTPNGQQPQVQQPVQIIPGQIGTPTPFGAVNPTANPFGTPQTGINPNNNNGLGNTNPNNNNLFGNTNVLGGPQQQPPQR